MVRVVFLVPLLAILAACSPPEPLRIGFIGGLSGRVADLGEAGRNGAQIAVDEFNQAGGINGRPVELIVRDDGQSPEKAIAAMNDLVDMRVAAIVGPMTSAMADVVLPIAQRTGVVLVSPTVTARKFFGLDDNLFLVMSSTREEAMLSAGYHYRHNGTRRVAAIHDLRNRSYTESWLEDFTVAFQALGGDVVPVSYESSPDADVQAIVRRVLASRPDAVLLITNAVDAARFAQKIRAQQPALLLFASQWATTERLIELGGKAVEGMVLHNYFDQSSTAEGLQRLRHVYGERFRREPGFAGVAAYDATRALLEAAARRTGNESLRDALKKRGPFAGAEGGITFDSSGDSRRVPHITVVQDGRFVVLH
jgi:branched-chain amino acid transport system substrate-binding protein